MRQDLTVTKELSFSNDMVEAIILKVEELKGLVIGVYRPPNTTKDKWNEAVSELREGVIKIQSISDKYVNIWAFGDYNFPGVDWVCGELSGQALAWNNFCEEFFLSVVNSEATRGEKMLDLVLTNNEATILNNEIVENVTFSDHAMIITNLNFDFEKKVSEEDLVNLYNTAIPCYNFKDGDFEDWLRFKCVLESLDWEVNDNVGGIVRNLWSNLQEAVVAVFPKKKKKLKGNRIPKVVRKLLRKKRQISNKMRRTKCWRKHVNLQDELSELEAKLKKRYEKDRDRKEKKAIRSIVTDPNYFYNYAKKFSRESKLIGPLLKDEGCE